MKRFIIAYHLQGEPVHAVNQEAFEAPSLLDAIGLFNAAMGVLNLEYVLLSVVWTPTASERLAA